MLIVLTGLVAIPVMILALETFLSLAALRRGFAKIRTSISRPRVAVLIPAHNEEAVIAITLEQISAQLENTDLFVVVADNCSDKTAELARDAGATVLVRTDKVKRGKGYALDHGFRFIAQSPPDVIVIIDADCLIESGLIGDISALAIAKNQPVQALYIMKHSSLTPALGRRLTEFTWRIKNHTRPLGLKSLNLPCQLMGTGMAIPFEHLREVKLGSSNIVEDVQLGIDLTIAGYPPYFCSDLKVTSSFPESESAEKEQRKRWEHGHLGMIFSQVPKLTVAAIARRDLKLFALALDLSIPPLTLLAILVLFLVAASGLAMLTGSGEIPFILGGITLMLFLFTVFMAWLGYGRDVLSFSELLFLPVLILKKIPLYIQFAVNRQKGWIRTKRD